MSDGILSLSSEISNSRKLTNLYFLFLVVAVYGTTHPEYAKYLVCPSFQFV